MRNSGKIAVAMLAGAWLAVGAVGCKCETKAEGADAAKAAQPKAEHPAGEHAKGEHPKGEHPK